MEREIEAKSWGASNANLHQLSSAKAEQLSMGGEGEGPTHHLPWQRGATAGSQVKEAQVDRPKARAAPMEKGGRREGRKRESRFWQTISRG